MKSSTMLLALLVAATVAVPSARAESGIQVNADASVNSGSGSVSGSGDGNIIIKNERSGDDLKETDDSGMDSGREEQERSGLLKNALGAEIRAAADVVTEEDLDAFEENLLVTDSRIADADSSNKRVGVAFWHSGRFFGVFPVKVQSRTDVEIGTEDTLNVSTTMPWWSFFVTGLGSVKKEVETELLANGQFTADVLASEDAHARARALESIASAHANIGSED